MHRNQFCVPLSSKAVAEHFFAVGELFVTAGNGAERRNPARAVTKGMKADFSQWAFGRARKSFRPGKYNPTHAALHRQTLPAREKVRRGEPLRLQASCRGR